MKLVKYFNHIVNWKSLNISNGSLLIFRDNQKSCQVLNNANEDTGDVFSGGIVTFQI